MILPLLLAASVSAQPLQPFNAAGSAAWRAQSAAMAKAEKARADMQAAGGTGLRLVMLMDDAHLPVNIIEPKSGLCELGVWDIGNGQKEPSVNCSTKLAGVSTPEAVLAVSERGAERVWTDFPASAEKDFIIVSLMARSWLEAGGKRADLKTMKDRALAARLEAWFGKKLRDYARDSGRGLADLKKAAETRLASASCQSEERGLMAEIDSLEKAQERAKHFSNEEDDWAKRNWRILGLVPR